MAPRCFGLIINPIAGMGGPSGLKGTDGEDVLAEALHRGALPVSGDKVARALAEVPAELRGAKVLVPSGAMGESAARNGGFRARRVIEVPVQSRPEHTVNAARRMADSGAEFIVFGGGDGTARDIHSVIGDRLPLLGIPAGVKMQSGVFATSPAAAGRLIALLLSENPGGTLKFRPAEVMDIHESEYRAGRIMPRLYGYATVPAESVLLQQAKSRAVFDDDAAIVSAAATIAASLERDVSYVIGPGRSAKQVLKVLGLEGCLLGVDLVRNGNLVGTDLAAADIRAMTAGTPIRIVAGVTGAQGFLFGRGNQQIAPDIIAQAGRSGVIVIAGIGKLSALVPPRLLVDTGDPRVDKQLCGYVRVCCGGGRWSVMRIAAG